MNGKFFGTLLGLIVGAIIAAVCVSVLPQNTDVEKGSALIIALIVIGVFGFAGYLIGKQL